MIVLILELTTGLDQRLTVGLGFSTDWGDHHLDLSVPLAVLVPPMLEAV